MISIAGVNITSSLGLTARDTYAAVGRGQSGLSLLKGDFLGVQEDIIASRVDDTLLSAPITERVTRLERMAIHSVSDAMKGCNAVDPASVDTIFIISTTKGNIDILEHPVDGVPTSRVALSEMASVIAREFNNPNKPLVVSNACISGVAAILTARRLLATGVYKNAIVVGVDELTRFTVSGFQSFKALSPEECRPFDRNRTGLNLGEAAATMILTTKHRSGESWLVENGAVRNDANHISGPSRTGEGSYRALQEAIKDCDIQQIAVINAHGTATPYNDEMESIAIDRAGLSAVPVNALKGFFGHTLGAAGVLESILTMISLDEGILLPTRGYTNSGVSRPLDVVDEVRPTSRRAFVKLMSGFGGCNAALLFRKEAVQ